MKKALFIFSLFANLCFADVFYNADTALAHAEKNNKLLVVIAVSDTCHHCHDFLAKLNESGTMDIMSNKYDVVILEIKNNLDIFTNVFNIEVTPTTFILDPKKPQVKIPEIKGKADGNSILNYLSSVEKELIKIY